LNTEGLTYFLITIPKFWSIPISLGLCLPDVCRIEDLEDFKMSIVDSVNAAAPIVFRGIKGIHEGKIMKPKHLKFIQPQEENKIAYSFDFGSGLILFLFSVLILCLIGGTGHQIYLKQKSSLIPKEEPEKKSKKKRKENKEKKVPTSPSKKVQATKMQKLSSAFSVQNGMVRLFRPYSANEEPLNGINALRVICMLFVVLGSTFFRVLRGSI
jgi:hypothetical protein